MLMFFCLKIDHTEHLHLKNVEDNQQKHEPCEEQRMRTVPIQIDRVRTCDNTNTTDTVYGAATGVKTPVTDILRTAASR